MQINSVVIPSKHLGLINKYRDFQMRASEAKLGILVLA